MTKALRWVVAIAGAAIGLSACASTSQSSSATTPHGSGFDCAALSRLYATYSINVSHVAAGMDGVSVGQQIATPTQIKREAAQARTAIDQITSMLTTHATAFSITQWKTASGALLGDYERAALERQSPQSMEHLDTSLSLTHTGFEATTSGSAIGAKVRLLCPGISAPQIAQPTTSSGN